MNGMITGFVSSISRYVGRTLETGRDISNDIPREKQEIKPTTEKQRHRCPFYGFYIAPGVLLDSEGNQCALITNSYSPCQMHICGELPNWGACPINTEEKRKSVEVISDFFMVFPQEFKPKDKKSWEGMPFKEWQEHVMGKHN